MVVVILTLAGYPLPTKATVSFLSAAGQGRDNITKGFWAEIRTWRDLSPVTVMGKMQGNQFNLLPVKSE